MQPARFLPFTAHLSSPARYRTAHLSSPARYRRLQPYDFIIPVMRGVGSRMDTERQSPVPHSTSIACPSFGGRGLFNINNLVDCITEAGSLFGQWTSGISTRGYANDILKIALAHEAQSYPGAFTPKRLVYGRGYGGQVVNDLQHIVNCNYLAGSERRRLRCSYPPTPNNNTAFVYSTPLLRRYANEWRGPLPTYCSSPSTPFTYRRLPPSFSFTSYIIDGTRDLDKSDSSMWIQATNLVAHSALQTCPSSKCRQLYNNDPYLAARDALALLRSGWCSEAIYAGFSRDILIQAASAFSFIGSTPAYSSMASATLPFLNAIIFRYIRCNAEDVKFLAAAANSPAWPSEFANRYRLLNLLVLFNVIASEEWSNAVATAKQFDQQYTDSSSPFIDNFVSNYLVYAMGMWPVPYESNTVQTTGRSFISCYPQPMLIMHGSLDVQSIPAGYVDNLGTISSTNAAVQTVFQQNAGHTVFYTASACVWMYLQQLQTNGFLSAGAYMSRGYSCTDACDVIPEPSPSQACCLHAGQPSTSTGISATTRSFRQIASGRGCSSVRVGLLLICLSAGTW